MEILNNVKADKSLFLEQPTQATIAKKPTAGLQLNFKKMTNPEKPRSLVKQQNHQDADSFVSVEEAPVREESPKRKVISYKEEQIVSQKGFEFNTFFELK